MRAFLDDDYLLNNDVAKTLYHQHAKKMPIFDFHCHLPIKEIYENKTFSSLGELWLSCDHYKWRVMRQMGIKEKYISGDGSYEEKFNAWADMVPDTVGNPLYLWTHLELLRYFHIAKPLGPSSKKEIYASCNETLQHLSVRDLIQKSNVKALFTTDDPTADLSYHRFLKEDTSFPVTVLPAFRPDQALKIEADSFLPWLTKLEAIAGDKINNYSSLKKALCNRIDAFDEIGCVASDHGLDSFSFEEASDEVVEAIFNKACNKKDLTVLEVNQYKTSLLVFLGKEYAKRNWVQQYHIGALRNVSKRQYQALGPDSGFDVIDDQPYASSLAKLLNALDVTNELPKTILYCLNPRDHEVLAAIINAFQSPKIVSKVQFGSAWWYNDQIDGMEKQIETLMQMSLLSQFVGMVTDSRSFISYPRHEVFRRVLCNKIGTLVETGLYPNDLLFLGKVVENICYYNAVQYFQK